MSISKLKVLKNLGEFDYIDDYPVQIVAKQLGKTVGTLKLQGLDGNSMHLVAETFCNVYRSCELEIKVGDL